MSWIVVLSYLYQFVVFILALILAIFIPGFVLTNRLKELRSLQRMVLIFGVGIATFSLQGYIFGYMQQRWLSYLLLGVFFSLGWQSRFEIFSLLRRSIHDISHHPKSLLFLCCIGVLLQSLQMVGSGLQLTAGMPFFRVHAQDGIFHLSLIESIIRSFPPNEPGSAFTPVVNYHYWSDLTIAEFSRIFRIPVHMLFFQFIPPVISLFTAVAVLSVVSQLGQQLSRRMYQAWQFFAIFFLFFGADVTYVFMLILHGKFGFYTSAIDNGATQFLNMPHAFAKLLFFISLWTFLYWRKTKKRYYSYLSVFLSSVLFGMKVYFGLLNAGILILYGIFELFELIKRRDRAELQRTLGEYITYGIFAISASALVYLPTNRDSGGLSWYPLEWVKLMIAEENLDWRDMRYRMAIAEYLHLDLKLALYSTIALVVTALSIHGTRLLGFLLPIWKTDEKKFWFSTTIMCLLFTGVGFTTLQVSGGFNVFNFFASSLSLLSLSTALVMAGLFTMNRRSTKILVIALCILTLPRTAYETGKILTSYSRFEDVVSVSRGEQTALQYVSESAQMNEIIQSHPDNALDMHTPYVSYFAKRDSFLSGINVLETHNQPTESRKAEMKKLFETTDENVFTQLLHQNGIAYLYLRTGDSLRIPLTTRILRPVYTNESATVYKVQ